MKKSIFAHHSLSPSFTKTAFMNRYAVIDLGTNTFHLLIIEAEKNGIPCELYRERIFVKLAEEGITKIGKKAYQRGLDALFHFQKKIIEFEANEVKAFGTAALRTASNGIQFIQDAKKKTGILIELIAGREEARLIHLGVLQAVTLDHEKGLIMDIGGGSVEFIIADKNEVFWAESFPIGVAVLHGTFHKNEPVSSIEIHMLRAHLEAVLQPLFDMLKLHQTPCLIGASGTFDVLETLLPLAQKTALSTTIDVATFQPLFQKILQMDLEKRRAEKGIPTTRADMIIVALILIDFIIKKANIKKIMVSAYAMKEGILWEMRRG